MGQRRVGPDHEEEVREAGHRGARVGLDAVGLPELGEPDAVATDDVLGVRGLGGLEARAHDDDVDRAGDAVLAHDLVRGEGRHR